MSIASPLVHFFIIFCCLLFFYNNIISPPKACTHLKMKTISLQTGSLVTFLPRCCMLLLRESLRAVLLFIHVLHRLLAPSSFEIQHLWLCIALASLFPGWQARAWDPPDLLSSAFLALPGHSNDAGKPHWSKTWEYATFLDTETCSASNSSVRVMCANMFS